MQFDEETYGDEERFKEHFRNSVARFAKVRPEHVTFQQCHEYINPPVCSLEVEGKGLYFAMDVVLEFDRETYIVPYGEKVKTPRDVHKSLRNFLRRTGRGYED
jgi:hypothetical protein